MKELADEAAGRELDRARKLKAEEDDKNKLDVMEMFDLLMMVWEETFERLMHELDVLNEATEKYLEELRDDLEKIQEKATVLPDGRRVYLSRDGKTAYYEDGTKLSAEDTAAVQWKPDSPAWETRQDNIQKTEEAERFKQRIEADRKRLKSATPQTIGQEELERIESDLEQAMPEGIRHHRDRLLAERPEPEARAVRDARTDDDRKHPLSAAVRQLFAVRGLPSTPRAGVRAGGFEGCR